MSHSTGTAQGLFSLTELEVTAFIQGIVTQVVVPNVISYILRAVMSAAGIDPKQLLMPVFQQVTEAFHMGDIVVGMMESLGVRLQNLDVKALIGQLLKIVKVLTIITLGFDIAFSVYDIVKLMLGRSVTNVYEVVLSVFTIFMSIRDVRERVEVEVNPDPWVDLWADPKMLVTENHHMVSWFNRTFKNPDRSFEKLFASAGITQETIRTDSALNIQKVAGHKGRHRESYHRYVYDKITNNLREAEEKTLEKYGRSLTTDERRREIEKSLGAIRQQLLDRDPEIYIRLIPRNLLLKYGITPI